MAGFKGIKIESFKPPPIMEVKRPVFEFKGEKQFTFAGEGLTSKFARSNAGLSVMTVTPDLRKSPGVQRHLTLQVPNNKRIAHFLVAQTKPRPLASLKNATGTALLAAGAAIAVKNSEIGSWMAEQIKYVGSSLSLGLLPVLGMVAGSGKSGSGEMKISRFSDYSLFLRAQLKNAGSGEPITYVYEGAESNTSPHQIYTSLALIQGSTQQKRIWVLTEHDPETNDYTITIRAPHAWTWVDLRSSDITQAETIHFQLVEEWQRTGSLKSALETIRRGPLGPLLRDGNFPDETWELFQIEPAGPQNTLFGPQVLANVTVAKGAKILNMIFGEETIVDALELNDESYYARFNEEGKIIEVGKK